MSNEEVIRDVLGGYRAPRPPGCSEMVYSIMMNCWASEPADRPLFDALVELLDPDHIPNPETSTVDGRRPWARQTRESIRSEYPSSGQATGSTGTASAVCVNSERAYQGFAADVAAAEPSELDYRPVTKSSGEWRAAWIGLAAASAHETKSNSPTFVLWLIKLTDLRSLVAFPCRLSYPIPAPLLI